MTRGIRAVYRSFEDGSVLARLVAVLLCPKSMDFSDENENRDRPELHLSSNSQLGEMEFTVTFRQSKQLTNLMTDAKWSASTSNATETTEFPSPLEPWGKRFCDHEAGPLRKRRLQDRYETPPFTSSVAQSPNSTLEIGSDVSVSNMSPQSKEFAVAMLAQYDAITCQPFLKRERSPMYNRPTELTRNQPHMKTWMSWVGLFMPCATNEHRQDGIAALAQLRHMLRRQGFMRFATELASLSQTYRTQPDHIKRVRDFMKAYELLGEASPLNVAEQVDWGPLRRLVVAGKCPAFLVHKALEDQTHAAGVLRPFLSFLAAAAEVYEALPLEVQRKLDNEVGPEMFVVRRNLSLGEQPLASKAKKKMIDPVVESLLKLRSQYFDKLNVFQSRKSSLVTFLSYLGALRYVKEWSPAETFVLNLANVFGLHSRVADRIAERPIMPGYWSVLPRLTQLVSLESLQSAHPYQCILIQMMPLDSLPSSNLRDGCEDLLSFIRIRLASEGQRLLYPRDFKIFWLLAEAMYDLLTSPETLQAALALNGKFDAIPVAENPLLEEDSGPYPKTLNIPPAEPLESRNTAKHVPKVWRDWAVLRDSVLPRDTSHRDMEAIVDVQLRPCLDTSDRLMNFMSGLAAVMWPRDWFPNDAVSSYDKLLAFFHNPAYIRNPSDLGRNSIFNFADFDKAQASRLIDWARRGMCNPVALKSASNNAPLHSLLVRAASLLPHVKEDLFSNRAVVTSCPIPAFPQTGEVIVDPILNAFRAHAAHFLEPAMKHFEFFIMLRMLLSLRSFKQLNTAEQIVMDLAAAVCVTLPGEPGHSPFWISGETFHSIMARRPSWQQLFASTNMLKVNEKEVTLFDFTCLNLAALFRDICMNHSSDWTKNVEYFDKLLSFARCVVKASNEDWLFQSER